MMLSAEGAGDAARLCAPFLTGSGHWTTRDWGGPHSECLAPKRIIVGLHITISTSTAA